MKKLETERRYQWNGKKGTNVGLGSAESICRSKIIDLGIANNMRKKAMWDTEKCIRRIVRWRDLVRRGVFGAKQNIT